MIQLINVSCVRQYAGRTRIVLYRLNASFPDRTRTAIIGGSGSGKSTLARFIFGAEQPSSGLILRGGGVSPVLGSTGGMNFNLSGPENVALLAGLLGVDRVATLAFVQAFSELGPDMQLPLKYYSPAMRARLGFGLSFALQNPFILADETTGAGDAAFRQKCDATLMDRLDHSGLILVSSNPTNAQKLCDRFYALAQGRLFRCETAQEAQILAQTDTAQFGESTHV
jgi:capsular polysaccharide transport system ATP-binding protein